MPDHYTCRAAKFGSISSPIGTQITQAVGFAWAAKMKKEDLATLVYFDVLRIWHVLALAVVTGTAQAFGGPAYQSLLPSLVDKQPVPNALIPVNPLGLTITYFRQDQAFQEENHDR